MFLPGLRAPGVNTALTGLSQSFISDKCIMMSKHIWFSEPQSEVRKCFLRSWSLIQYALYSNNRVLVE